MNDCFAKIKSRLRPFRRLTERQLKRLKWKVFEKINQSKQKIHKNGTEEEINTLNHFHRKQKIYFSQNSKIGLQNIHLFKSFLFFPFLYEVILNLYYCLLLFDISFFVHTALRSRFQFLFGQSFLLQILGMVIS